MKRIFLFLAVAAMATFSSCQGDDGAQGPAGPVSQVFEVTTNFIPTSNPETTYRSFYDFGSPIYSTDNVLVYELSGVSDSGLDIWKLLPQVYTFPQGIMQYNYDFTIYDFSLFIDANFDRSILTSAWTQNQTFRIVIVPGDPAGKAKQIDTKDYNTVLRAYNIDDSNIKVLKQKIKS